MRMLREFLMTLGFMTRLVPPQIASDEEMRRMMGWIPVTGLALGLVLAVPLAFGLLDGKPWVQAWLVVLTALWLTRGLHYDGIADVADAFTAHFDPERFWVVLKDSRCGAFGVLALVMVGIGQVVLFAQLLEQVSPWVVIWPFVAGRLNCVIFGLSVKELARPGLGALSYAGASPPVLAVSVIWVAGLGFSLLPAKAVLLSLVLQCISLIPLYRLAKKVNGCNGDFLGASIILGEVSALLGLVAVS